MKIASRGNKVCDLLAIPLEKIFAVKIQFDPHTVVSVIFTIEIHQRITDFRKSRAWTPGC